MAFDGKEGEEFPIATAAEWTANYRTANPNGIKAHFFGKDILNAILSQTGCMGIRMYYALDENGVQQMILVGANASQNDLYDGVIAERARPCPTYCDSSSSPLNG